MEHEILIPEVAPADANLYRSGHCSYHWQLESEGLHQRLVMTGQQAAPYAGKRVFITAATLAIHTAQTAKYTMPVTAVWTRYVSQRAFAQHLATVRN